MIETERLIVRRMTVEDAAFMLALMNDPAWLRFIGDRGVKTVADAQDYIRNGPLETYARLGFGFYVVDMKDGGAAVGICGLVRRDYLDDVDIGYAFLPQYRGQGYAREAARAVLAYAQSALGLTRVVAITNPDNARSEKVLQALGLRFERVLERSGDVPDLNLFAIEFG